MEIRITHKNNQIINGKILGHKGHDIPSQENVDLNENEYNEFCFGYAEGLVFFDLHNQTKTLQYYLKLNKEAQKRYDELYDTLIKNPKLWK
jgi:hypothetical protein